MLLYHKMSKNIIEYSSSGIPLHYNKAVKNVIIHNSDLLYPIKHYIINYKDNSISTLITNVDIKQQFTLNKYIK